MPSEPATHTIRKDNTNPNIRKKQNTSACAAQSSMHPAGPLAQHKNQSALSADMSVTGNLSAREVPLQVRKGVNILERRDIPASLNWTSMMVSIMRWIYTLSSSLTQMITLKKLKLTTSLSYERQKHTQSYTCQPITKVRLMPQ